MTTLRMLPSSDKTYILSFQNNYPTVEESLQSLIEPSTLSNRFVHEPIALIVCRVISTTRFLLAPLEAHQSCGVSRALLTEAALKAVDEQFPGLRESMKIGSIIEARLQKLCDRESNISHFVSRVEKIWNGPLFPVRATSNIVQVKLECDLSEKGRCRREIMEREGGKEEIFFILKCKYGIEASISVKRLMDYLGDDMTIKGSILECDSILMEGGPTSFMIRDTCKIIKKTKGRSDEIIPARRNISAHETKSEDI